MTIKRIRIFEEHHGEIGLIGLGDNCLTHCLERLCGGSEICHLHSCLYDAYGKGEDTVML